MHLYPRRTLSVVFDFFVELARGAGGEDGRPLKVVVIERLFVFWVHLLIIAGLCQDRQVLSPSEFLQIANV